MLLLKLKKHLLFLNVLSALKEESLRYTETRRRQLSDALSKGFKKCHQLELQIEGILSHVEATVLANIQCYICE